MSRPVRVAHVATVDVTHRYLLLPQYRRLLEEGYEVTAVSAPGAEVPAIEAAGVRFVPWPGATRAWDPGNDLRAFRSLVDILRREAFDLVHLHNPKPGVIGRIGARIAGVPCVVNTVHGLYTTPDDPLTRRAPVLAAEWLAARFSDLELYQSEEDLRWARRLGIVEPPPSALLGNGIDVRRFDPAAVPAGRREALLRDLGIPGEALVVGTVGRLVVEKGYRELLAAARRIRATAPDVRFLAVGPHDPAKWDAMGEHDVRGAEGVIHFTGWRADVRDLLAAMDVFVLASWREGMPRSAIEAAAMGRPLVLTDIRGCREVVRDGKEGFLVPRRDPRALGDAILRLIGDPALRRRMGAAARSRAVERFDERRVVEVLSHAYRDLLARRGLSGRGEPVRRFDDQGTGTVTIRPATQRDAQAVARWHMEIHPDAFLPQLGERFLLRLYRAMIDDPDTPVLVAEREGELLGFISGAVSLSDFYRRFVRSQGLAAAAEAAPRLLRPGVPSRLLETLRYPAKARGFPEAEFVSITVIPTARSRRLGGELCLALQEAMAARGVEEARATVFKDNEPSNRMLTRLGFERRGEIVVHDGHVSNVYVIPCRRPDA